jgi:hypothetical protein
VHVIALRRFLVLSMLLAGCYETPKPDCLFLCGAGDACPDGYQCAATDNRCHRVESGGGLAVCTEPLPIDAAGPIDSSLFDASSIDASLVDATPIDSAPAPDAVAACAIDLAPTSDGSSAALQAVILAEINPGTYLELYNNTGADLDLGASAMQLVSGTVTVPMSTAGAGVTVLAGGRAEIAWPAALTDPTDAGGEVVLYLDATPVDADIMDFVCWGTAPTTSLKTNAEAVNKWTGICPVALTLGAIHRLPASDGVDATDYDALTAPSPETCGP